MDNERRKRKRQGESNECNANEAMLHPRQDYAQAQADSLRLSSDVDRLYRYRMEMARLSLQAQGVLRSSPVLPQPLHLHGPNSVIPGATLHDGLLQYTASLAARPQLLQAGFQRTGNCSNANTAALIALGPRNIPYVYSPARNVPFVSASQRASFSASGSTPLPSSSLLLGAATNAQNAVLQMSLLNRLSSRQYLYLVSNQRRQTTSVLSGFSPQTATAADAGVARIPDPQQQYQRQPNLEASPNGRAAVLLYLPCDDQSLTPYQSLARRQIELFEASSIEVEAGTQGRNRSVALGQVGIRCRHCAALKLTDRPKGSMYYPKKLQGLYQASQNMSNSHLTQQCTNIPQDIQDELQRLGNKKSSAGGGKDYWRDGAKALGVVEDEHGLRFEKRLASRPFDSKK